MDEEEETLFDEGESDLSQLKAFDRQDNSEEVPEGFTSATIFLDAKPSSSLNWTQERLKTQELIEKGYKVLFELDLDLFGPTTQALTHTGQFQTHVLAINEFTGRFLAEFQPHTVGVILHRSKSPFTNFQERDVMVDYLELLRQEIADHIPCFLLFDCQALQDPFTFIRLFALDRFSLFSLALTHAPVLLKTVIWQEGKGMLGSIARTLIPQKQEEPTLGLLMPRFDLHVDEVHSGLKAALDTLLLQNRPFKIIPETHLPIEWNGLDELIVCKEGLLPTTLRAIDGFCAAGGLVRELVDGKQGKIL